MQPIDWLVVVVFILALTLVAASTKRFTKSVADFLAANRCAGRYLISTADGMVAFGLTSVIMFFEMFYEAGFTAQWWQLGLTPFITVLYLTGWVVYRFRRTRSLTLLQFFELRYSKRFRIFVGVLSFGVFLTTMGIMPATGARFFMYACNLPQNISLAGFEVSTFITIMLILLGTALAFTLAGGHIAVMVTDFLQGMFSNIILLVLMFVLVILIPWNTLIDGLLQAPAEASKIHPFHTGEIKTYDFWFFLIWGFNFFYVFPAWQGVQGYHGAAKNPHEARMARVLGNIRGIVLYNAVILIPVVAYVLMHHPQFADIAAGVKTRVAAETSDYYAKQVTVTTAISTLIPKGLFGLFIAAMFAAMISTLDTLLHAWGSIFVQDVLLPFRKKPFSRKTHMWLLRGAIIGVAAFIFTFSLLYKQKQDIWLFWAIIGSFYYGGAGSALIFGLYWKRGTTTAAWTGMLTGIVLTAVAYSLQRWTNVPLPDSQRLSVFIALTSIASYLAVTLLRRRVSANFDRIFHRGEYAVDDDRDTDYGPVVTGINKLLGINEHFSTADRVIYYLVTAQMALTFIAFTVVCILNLLFDIGNGFWSILWKIYIWQVLILGTGVTLWFVIGGAFNLRELYQRLASIKRNDLDDGMVVDHTNLEEQSLQHESTERNE
jgi:SSS family solute:Na+ symporter